MQELDENLEWVPYPCRAAIALPAPHAGLSLG